MSDSVGRPALAVSLPNPPRTPSPTWLAGLVSGLVEDGLVSAAVGLVGDGAGETAAAAAGDALAGSRGRVNWSKCLRRFVMKLAR